MKENGADALELQLSFNEKSLYEKNMHMIKREINVENIKVSILNHCF
jgi:hypothetical protein